MRTLGFVALLPLLAGVAVPDDGFSWHHEGYPQIFDAAAAAKTSGRRLLIGVPGAGS